MAVFISLSNFHTHLIFLLYRNFKDILRVFYMNVNYQQKNNIACRSLFYILTTRGSQEKIVSITIVVVPLSFFFDFFLLISQCILLLLTSKLRIAPLTHHIDLHIFFFFWLRSVHFSPYQRSPTLSLWPERSQQCLFAQIRGSPSLNAYCSDVNFICKLRG